MGMQHISGAREVLFVFDLQDPCNPAPAISEACSTRSRHKPLRSTPPTHAVLLSSHLCTSHQPPSLRLPESSTPSSLHSVAKGSSGGGGRARSPRFSPFHADWRLRSAAS